MASAFTEDSFNPFRLFPLRANLLNAENADGGPGRVGIRIRS